MDGYTIIVFELPDHGGYRMICPSCRTSIHFQPEKSALASRLLDRSDGYEIAHGYCPQCEQYIVVLRQGEYRWIQDRGELINIKIEEVIYPRYHSRSIDESIPKEYLDVFNEANAVMVISPKASAALSRRLLQTILRNEYSIQRKDLYDEIGDFLNISDLPSEIKDSIDAVRSIGNFAAHPIKSQSTGQIADVEPGEAEWLLEVLEMLFDYRFIQPKKVRERTDKLNQKLRGLGKSPIR